MSTIDYKAHVTFRILLDVAHFALPRRSWADRFYLRLKFFVEHGRWPSDAMRFNDYLFAYTQSDSFQDPLIALTTCKLQAKEFLQAHFPSEHIIPTLGVLRSPEEIDAYEFPDQCVLKGTAASGQCIYKGPEDAVDRATLKRWIRKTHFHRSREVNYKPLKNMVIVEPPVTGAGLKDDLKINVWRGKLSFMFLACEEHGERRCQLYDPNWTMLPFACFFPKLATPTPRPDCLDAMQGAAMKVGSFFDLVRVDFFYEGSRWWFGEITHFNGGAISSFDPLDGEAIANKLTFGEAAYDGPIEKHGALGSKGPPAAGALSV